MRTILTAPRVVELDRIETDLIKRCLSKEETAQYFVRYANDWRWVEWLYREGLLARYLNARYAHATRVERFLGLWLGAHLACELTGRGLWLINEYSGQMGGWVAEALGQKLAEDSSIEIASEGAQTWILLLAQSKAYPRWAEMLGRLLVRVAKQGLWPLAMRLLRQGWLGKFLCFIG